MFIDEKKPVNSEIRFLRAGGANSDIVELQKGRMAED